MSSVRPKIKLYMCGGESSVSQYPLGLGYLLTNCPQGDLSIASNPKELVDCDLIGLSSNAWGISEAIDILNSKKIPVMIGGQSTLWDGLINYDFAHIVVGEGEQALHSILQGGAEKYIKTPLLKNIDSLAFPERGKCTSTVPILSSRGCPFDCSFCSSQEYWGKARFHSPEYFMSEVEYLEKKYPKTKEFYILDDLFIANKKRFRQIHELWMQSGNHKKFKLKSFIRSSMFNKDMGLMMKEMGFTSVRFGAESASDRVLKILNKRTTAEDHQRTIDIANEIGLPVSASFMYGIPGETEEDVEMTKRFWKRNEGRFSIEGYYQFQAFPGTHFYDGEDPTMMDMRVRSSSGSSIIYYLSHPKKTLTKVSQRISQLLR